MTLNNNLIGAICEYLPYHVKFQLNIIHNVNLDDSPAARRRRDRLARLKINNPLISLIHNPVKQMVKSALLSIMTHDYAEEITLDPIKKITSPHVFDPERGLPQIVGDFCDNPCVTREIIEKNPQIRWDVDALCRNRNFTYADLMDLRFDRDQILGLKFTTREFGDKIGIIVDVFEYVKNENCTMFDLKIRDFGEFFNKRLKFDSEYVFERYSSNPMGETYQPLTFEDLVACSNKSLYEWSKISSNPECTLKFALENKNHINWKIYSANINLTPENITRLPDLWGSYYLSQNENFSASQLKQLGHWDASGYMRNPGAKAHELTEIDLEHCLSNTFGY